MYGKLPAYYDNSLLGLQKIKRRNRILGQIYAPPLQRHNVPINNPPDRRNRGTVVINVIINRENCFSGGESVAPRHGSSAASRSTTCGTSAVITPRRPNGATLSTAAASDRPHNVHTTFGAISVRRFGLQISRPRYDVLRQQGYVHRPRRGEAAGSAAVQTARVVRLRQRHRRDVRTYAVQLG